MTVDNNDVVPEWPLGMTPELPEGYPAHAHSNDLVSGGSAGNKEEYAEAASAEMVFSRASERSGGIVSLDPQFGCLPMIIGQDGEPVLMYRFVEILHELVSLAEIQQELPSLSYRQIEGGIAFLRALAQFNLRGLDIDVEEEKMVEASPEFQKTIREALDLEPARVFTFDQQAVRRGTADARSEPGSEARG